MSPTLAVRPSARYRISLLLHRGDLGTLTPRRAVPFLVFLVTLPNFTDAAANRANRAPAPARVLAPPQPFEPLKHLRQVRQIGAVVEHLIEIQLGRRLGQQVAELRSRVPGFLGVLLDHSVGVVAGHAR